MVIRLKLMYFTGKIIQAIFLLNIFIKLAIYPLLRVLFQLNIFIKLSIYSLLRILYYKAVLFIFFRLFYKNFFIVHLIFFAIERFISYPTNLNTTNNDRVFSKFCLYPFAPLNPYNEQICFSIYKRSLLPNKWNLPSKNRPPPISLTAPHCPSHTKSTIAYTRAPNFHSRTAPRLMECKQRSGSADEP